MNTTIKMEPDASSRAIEAATRTQAQIVLESADFKDGTLNGFLVSGDERTLLMEVTGSLAAPTDRLVNVHCQARVYGTQRYLFATTIQSASSDGNASTLALSRPRSVSILERRRFRRARLAPSSKVNLTWTCGGGSRQQTGTILNVSPDGLACRLETQLADTIDKNDNLHVSFALPGLQRRFHLTAHVMSKTPASDGWTIIGLQFQRAPGTASHFAALRAALRSPEEVGNKADVNV